MIYNFLFLVNDMAHQKLFASLIIVFPGVLTITVHIHRPKNNQNLCKNTSQVYLAQNQTYCTVHSVQFTLHPVPNSAEIQLVFGTVYHITKLLLSLSWPCLQDK